VDHNDYIVGWDIRERLEAARADARQRALASQYAACAMPRIADVVRALGVRYGRWSSAASTGSKPTTVRA
jgi:hypothetical protein